MHAYFSLVGSFQCVPTITFTCTYEYVALIGNICSAAIECTGTYLALLGSIRSDDDFLLLADEDLGKVDGQFLYDRSWLLSAIFDAPHFGHAKAWDENDWEAARSVCLLSLSFAALCLSVSFSLDFTTGLYLCRAPAVSV